MKIQCENCQGIYNVDDSKIPEKGARVRCKKCNHSFIIKPNPESQNDTSFNTVRCPACNTGNNEGDLECVKCGIIFEKYEIKRDQKFKELLQSIHFDDQLLDTQQKFDKIVIKYPYLSGSSEGFMEIYEQVITAIHSEQYDNAIKLIQELISLYPDCTEKADKFLKQLESKRDLHKTIDEEVEDAQEEKPIENSEDSAKDDLIAEKPSLIDSYSGPITSPNNNHGVMKGFGFLLITIGAIWILVAFNMDTTARTESHFIGTTYIPSIEVNNIGKMDERRNHILISTVMLICGVMLFGFATISSKRELPEGEQKRKCPFCAEFIKAEAIACRYCSRESPAEYAKALVLNEKKYCHYCSNNKYHGFSGYKCKLSKSKTDSFGTCKHWQSKLIGIEEGHT